MFSKIAQASTQRIASSTQRAGFSLSIQPPKISKGASEEVIPSFGFRPDHKPASANATNDPPTFCHVWLRAQYEQTQKSLPKAQRQPLGAPSTTKMYASTGLHQ